MAASDTPLVLSLHKRRFGLPEYLNVLFGLTTIVSLLLAYYWHDQSVEKRIPLYTVQSRATLVSRSVPAPSDLQVLYKGQKLDADVNAVIVYLWNGGKLPVKSEDVLEPLVIETGPKCEILDSRILKVSRPATRFSAGEVNPNAKNRVPLSFSILEKNDGAAVQIIHSGGVFCEVAVKGTVVGAGAPHYQSPIEATNFFFFGNAKFLVTCQVLLVVCGYLVGWMTLSSGARIWPAALVLVVAGMLMFGQYRLEYQLPPFRSGIPPSISTG